MVLLAVMAGGLQVATAQASAPLIAEWPLDEAHVSGGTEYSEDVSGNGLALTSPANTMHFGTEAGKFGGYLAGTNTTPLEVNSPLLAPQQLTLLAWVKQSGNPGTLRYIAGRGDDGPTCGGSSYALYTGYSGNPGLHFYVRATGAGAPPVLTDAAPDSAVFDGNWHLVAGTYDGTDVRLFVDGSQIGTPKPAAGITYTSPITDSTSYVDGYPPAAGCAGQSDFPGEIDEVRVYDRALSASELGRLAAAPGPQPPVLVPDGSSGPAPSPGGSGPPLAPLTISVSPLQSQLSPHYTVLKLISTGLTSDTKISIDGGKPIIALDPTKTPYIGIHVAETGSHTITATSFGLGGAIASSSTHVTFSASSSEAKRAPFLPDAAVATTVPGLLLEAAELGAVSNECAPNTTLVFGVAEASGCFKRVETEKDIPKPERPVAEEYGSLNFLIEHIAASGICVPTCKSKLSASTLRTVNPLLKPYVSAGPVMLDGMTITPRPGAAVVVFPAINRVISSNARVSYDGSVFGSIPVQTGPLNLDLNSAVKRFTNGDAELPLFRFNTSETFKDIGGFPIDGEVQVNFKKTGERRYTALIVNVSLPKELSTSIQADPTAQVEVNAENARGTYVNHLKIHLGEAFLGPVQLANVDFTYDDEGNAAEECPRKWWKATAEVFFLPDDGDRTGLKMAPEPQRNGVAFCAGKFHSAGAILEFGAAAPEIFPGVTLNDIGFDIRLADPAIFDGSATIKSAELVTATGGFLTALASPGHPYTIQPGDAGGTIKQIAGQTFESPIVALGGTVSVEPFKEVGLELGGAYLLYNYPDYIAAKGYAHLQTFLFTINAEGGLELDTSTRKFNAQVKGEICLAGGIEVEHVGLCAGGQANVSSRGLSVCFDIAKGLWTPGVGAVYGKLPEFFTGLPGDGCKPSHFWETNVRAARASAVAPITFTVKRGEKTKNVALTGAGDAPEISVRAPDGETIVSQANKMFHSGHLSAIAADVYKTTWIGVDAAKPGTYQIISQPGSPAITGVSETRYEPDSGVSGKLTHKGRRYLLHYNAGHAAGQSVTFVEKGKQIMHVLRKVSGGHGTIAFEPQLGKAGQREVVAEVEVDGVPSPPQRIARFSAPPPRRAGKVTQVRVAHRGSVLAVSWRMTANAKSYTVAVVGSGGRVKTLRVKAKAHRVTVRGVAATEAGKVTVVAAGPLGDHGGAGTAHFRATRKQSSSRLLSYKELGSGAAFVKGRKKKPSHRRHR